MPGPHHADPFPLGDERTDHPRTGVRLAGAGRPLDRKDGLIELAGDLNRERQRISAAGLVECSGRETGRFPHQQCARNAIRV